MTILSETNAEQGPGHGHPRSRILEFTRRSQRAGVPLGLVARLVRRAQRSPSTGRRQAGFRLHGAQRDRSCGVLRGAIRLIAARDTESVLLLLLQVLGCESRPPRDAGQHSGADLLLVVEGEHEVGPTGALQRPV